MKHFLLDLLIALPFIIASAAVVYFVLKRAMPLRAPAKTMRIYRCKLAGGAALLSTGLFELGLRFAVDYWPLGGFFCFAFVFALVYIALGDLDNIR